MYQGNRAEKLKNGVISCNILNSLSIQFNEYTSAYLVCVSFWLWCVSLSCIIYNTD